MKTKNIGMEKKIIAGFLIILFSIVAIASNGVAVDIEDREVYYLKNWDTSSDLRYSHGVKNSGDILIEESSTLPVGLGEKCLTMITEWELADEGKENWLELDFQPKSIGEERKWDIYFDTYWTGGLENRSLSFEFRFYYGELNTKNHPKFIDFYAVSNYTNDTFKFYYRNGLGTPIMISQITGMFNKFNNSWYHHHIELNQYTMKLSWEIKKFGSQTNLGFTDKTIKTYNGTTTTTFDYLKTYNEIQLFIYEKVNYTTFLLRTDNLLIYNDAELVIDDETSTTEVGYDWMDLIYKMIPVAIAIGGGALIYTSKGNTFKEKIKGWKAVIGIGMLIGGGYFALIGFGVI